jgi:hypothetical protein
MVGWLAGGLVTTGLATGWLVGSGAIGLARAEAGTCASKCPKGGVKFAPGKLIAIEVANLTTGLIKVEDVEGSDPIAVSPGRTIRLSRRMTTGEANNASVVFWDSQGLALRAIVRQPQPLLMRVELRPGGVVGDQSVYLKDDGRIAIF